MTTMLSRKLSTTEAAKLARGALGLEDLHRLTIALAEAAAQEIMRNRAFADRVRALYEQVTVAPKVRRTDPFAVQLTPLRHVEGREINPAAPLDPRFLLEVYGPHQLETALGLFPISKLKEAATRIAERHPGSKPSNWGRKAPLVAYIVEYTTQ